MTTTTQPVDWAPFLASIDQRAWPTTATETTLSTEIDPKARLVVTANPNGSFTLRVRGFGPVHRDTLTEAVTLHGELLARCRLHYLSGVSRRMTTDYAPFIDAARQAGWANPQVTDDGLRIDLFAGATLTVDPTGDDTFTIHLTDGTDHSPPQVVEGAGPAAAKMVEMLSFLRFIDDGVGLTIEPGP